MRFTLRLKLVGAFAVVAGVTSVAGLLAMQGLESVSARYEHAMGTLSSAEQAAQGIDRGLEQKLLGVRGYALYMRSDMLQEIDQADKQIRTQADAFSALPVDDADKAVIQELLQTNKEMDELIKRAVSMVNGGKGKEAVELLSMQAPAISQKMSGLITPLVAKLETQVNEDEAAAVATGRQTVLFGYTVIGGALALALLVGLYMSSRIARPVRQVAALAGRMAQGDLTGASVEIRTRDEIADMAEAFTIMTARLRNLVQGITERAGAVLAAAEELTENAGLSAQSTEQVAAALGQVAAGASEQATAATEVERTLEELQQTIGQIAAGAQETAGQIGSSSELLGGIARAIEGVAG
ncbi:MAG TPA: methyl-accepting chemotaxis protein, partial [Symbiobacteriaceae bacterium]|nr:methyl-accepting chemotaxis protein [Symbiobacteriaceae bacterium]